MIPHILSIDDFSRDRVVELLCCAARMESLLEAGRPLRLLEGRILATVFFTPSTRTRLSFASAMHRLGGQVIDFSLKDSRSSDYTQESIHDTAQMLNGYADAVVFRHEQVEGLHEYIDASRLPVINAGAGLIGHHAEHPTQALVDLYTIHKELGPLEDRKVLLLGDLNWRVPHSIIKAFGLFPGIDLHLCAPDRLWMSREDEAAYSDRGIRYQRAESLEEVVKEVDVIYLHGPLPPVPEAVRLTRDRLEGIKPDTIILHPLPRKDDLDPSVDVMPQAKYFVQARNAIPIRMALLTELLGRSAVTSRDCS